MYAVLHAVEPIQTLLCDQESYQVIDSSQVENAMQDAITSAIDEMEAIAAAENLDEALVTQVEALCCLTRVWDDGITAID